MQLIYVILITAFSVKAIRVPTTWNQAQTGPYKPKYKRQFKPSATTEDWTPIVPKFEKHVHRESPPLLDHIPTKPRYPGKGVWSKRGPKHHPYIHKKQPQRIIKENGEKPEGYELFEQNRNLFKRHKKRFNERFQPEVKEEKEDFVPVRVYSQVRRTESESHLPPEEDDPRLREAIKDSKIHTVYTEEGYEDLAYDHAGHEKTAEENEGFGEFNREIEKEKKKDSQVAGSSKKPVTLSHLMQNQEIMEVKSEVKKEGSKTKKFVTILPKARSKRHIKYPYYHDSKVPLYSPLRYSEDLENIPKKTEDPLAFYNQANRIQCDEVISEINPIPERVTNGDAPDSSEELVPVQRLKGLGDKIDCFKAKFFGENPLDSPIFTEEVGAVIPPFETLITQSSDLKTNGTETSTMVPLDGHTIEPMISIITTPKYTIDLKPKNIYDQIKLLHHLPAYNLSIDGTTRSGKNLLNVTAPQALRYRRRRPRPRPYHMVQRAKNNFDPKDMKTSAQLNVFADVINNIKNSSRDPEQLAVASSYYRHKKLPQKEFSSGKRKRIPVVENQEDDNYVPIEATTKFYKQKIPVTEEDEAKYENLELLKLGHKPIELKKPVESSTKKPIEIHSANTRVFAISELNGMKLPNHINLFHVPGMKPPSKKMYHYSSFKRRRQKRSAQRPSYSVVVRNRNRPIDVDDEEVVVEDDDDYVPHRPKNYHYDEETGKIIYDTVTEVVPVEEVIEVTEIPIPKPTTRRNKLVATRPPGPSYIDFIKILKSDSKYEVITDPPTTEKGSTTTTTTMVPPSTTPPQFLGFLSKLRNNSNYMPLPDKTTTTTQVPLEEPEPELEPVQNSPGGQTVAEKYQIFDINEYLPKVKNYTPSTSIDYSKYKTIMRHNLSSRYKQEEETTKEPTMVPEIMMSESKIESTTTQMSSTRTRGTRRTTTPSTIKRVYPRRRPTRIKLPSIPDSDIEESTTAKVVRRRHQESTEIAKLNQTRQYPRKIADVQVFQKYDRTKKHGGNYEEKRLTDKELYTDPKLPKKINQLMEVGDVEGVIEEEEKEDVEEYDADVEASKVPVFIKDPDKRLYYYAPV